MDLFGLATKGATLNTSENIGNMNLSMWLFNQCRETITTIGGHSIAPKTTSANAASASP